MNSSNTSRHKPDDQEQVGDLGAGHGVHEAGQEAQLAEAGLGDGLAAELVALLHHLGGVERAALVLDPVEDHDEVAQGGRPAVVHAGLRAAPRARASSDAERRRSQQVGGAAEVELEALDGQGIAHVAEAGARRHPGHGGGAQELRRRRRGRGRRSDRPRCPRGPSSRGSAGPARSSSGGTPSRPACSSAAPRPASRTARRRRGPAPPRRPRSRRPGRSPRSRRPPAPRARGPGPRRGARRPGRQHPTQGRDRAGRWLVCARGASEGDRGSDAVLRRLPARDRGREGWRGQDHRNGRPGHRGRRGGSARPRGRGRGQERARSDARRRRRARLRGGGGGHRARARRHGRDPRPARSPPTWRCYEYLNEHGLRRLSQPAGAGRHARRGRHRGARDRRHPRAGQGEAARARRHRRPHRARRARPPATPSPSSSRLAACSTPWRWGRSTPRPATSSRCCRTPRVPGRAGHAPRGDAGQRAGRHGLRPGGRRRGQPLAGRGERGVPRGRRPRRRPGGPGRPGRRRPAARRRRRPARWRRRSGATA